MSKDPGPFFPIAAGNLMGCDRLGHFWDKNGDCRYCPVNQDDLLGPGAEP